MVSGVSDPDTVRNAVELQYQSSHGTIVGYDWSSSGCVTVGFESGFVAVDAVNVRENSSEGVYSCRLFPGGLAGLAVSPLLSRAAACSGNTVKVIQLGQGNDSTSYKELTDEQVRDLPISPHISPYLQPPHPLSPSTPLHRRAARGEHQRSQPL